MGLDDPIQHFGGSTVPNFLSDPPPVVFVLYAIAAMIAVAVWYRRRDRKSQVAMIASLAILAILVFLSYKFESPREEAIRRVNDVISAMNRFDSGLALEHVSDSFNYRGAKKGNLRSAPLNLLLRDDRAVLTSWDFARDDVQYDPSGNSVTIGFNVNVSGSSGSRPGFYVRATCIKDPDGQFRISTFKVHENAMQKANSSEFIVPGLGQ